MAAHEPAHPIELHLSRAELDLLRVALRHLLASEDDREVIVETKALLTRLALLADRNRD